LKIIRANLLNPQLKFSILHALIRNAKTRRGYCILRRRTYCGTITIVRASIPRREGHDCIGTNLCQYSDIVCDAKCPFCDTNFTRLRKLVKHVEKCKAKKKGLRLDRRQSEALRLKKNLCWSALEQLNRQLEARAARKSPAREGKQGEEEVSAQSDFVLEDNWEHDRGDSLLTTNMIESEQPIEDYAVYPVHPDGWAESVFTTEDLNQDQPDMYRTFPVHPDGWSEAVFAAEDLNQHPLDMYAVFPVHPDLWSQSVFTDGSSGVSQSGAGCSFSAQATGWSQSVFANGSSSETTPEDNLLTTSLHPEMGFVSC
jgi:hypothetical protein